MNDKKRESLVTINGEVMTTEERNRRMKLEYINGGKSLKDIAKDYGLTYNTVRACYASKSGKNIKYSLLKKYRKKQKNN